MPTRKKPRMTRQFASTFVIIDQPSGSGTTNVFVPPGGLTGCTGTGPFGVICASGTANPKNGEDAHAVHAKIFPGGTTTWPTDPPSDAVVITLNYGQRDWAFDSTQGMPDVPCARCGPDAGSAVSNVLVVWATYLTEAPESTAVEFEGVCASATDCGGASAVASQAYALAMPMRGARHMRIDAEGFAGETFAPFNGLWNLGLEPGKHGIWDNGGDGKKTPKVELRLNIKPPSLWQLAFKLGRAKAIYVQSNVNWAWSRPNDLIFIGADANKKGAPLLIRVTPA